MWFGRSFKHDGMIFSSYEKKNFKVNKSYWTYYMRVTNKRNGYTNYTGIFQVKLVKREKDRLTFEILNDFKLSQSMSYNIGYYMNGYGSSYCYFSEDKDDVIKHHDDTIKEFAKNQNSADRAKLEKKLIVKTTLERDKIEVESLKWLKTLTKKQLKYVEWVRDFYKEELYDEI